LYSILKAEEVGVNRKTFFDYTERYFEHIGKATSEAQRFMETGSFRITYLPQENASIEGRFWARIRFDLNVKGKLEERYLTYAFDEQIEFDELLSDFLDYLYEEYGIESSMVSNVSVEEMYRQW